MAWVWQYGPWRDGPEGELAGATGKTFTASVDDVSTVSFGLDGDSRHFGRIIPQTTDIWVVQDGDDCPIRCRATARSGSLTASRTSRAQGGIGYKALAVAADSGDSLITEWTDDPSNIAWAAFHAAQLMPGSNFAGIVRGPIRPFRNADVSLNFYASLNDNLDTVANQVHGAWDITPVTVGEQRFDYWPAGSRGTDRGIVIDLGGRAVSATDQVSVDSYANVVTNVGRPAEGSTDKVGFVRTAQVPDIATRPEGRWVRINSGDQVRANSVQDRANSDLAAAQIVPITWTAELARGWWQGRQHLWVGDPFTWVCRAPGYDLVETQTVNSLTADFSSDPQNPKVSIQFGAPAPSDRRRRRRVDQSLAALARRG